MKRRMRRKRVRAPKEYYQAKARERYQKNKENPEWIASHREYNRKWMKNYSAHPDTKSIHLENQKKYKLKSKESGITKLYHDEYYQRNKEKHSIYYKEYRSRNKEKIANYWKQRNKEKSEKLKLEKQNMTTKINNKKVNRNNLLPTIPRSLAAKRESDRNYYWRNREKRLKYQREYNARLSGKSKKSLIIIKPLIKNNYKKQIVTNPSFFDKVISFFLLEK